jgi:hypothetical protein
LNVVVNNRLGINISAIDLKFLDAHYTLGEAKKNINVLYAKSIYIDTAAKLTQPYWLEKEMAKGSFNVTDQRLIGKAENDPLSVDVRVNIEGTSFVFTKPIRFRFTDPVKGEIYQPVYVVPQVTLNVSPDLNVIIPGKQSQPVYHKKIPPLS